MIVGVGWSRSSRRVGSRSSRRGAGRVCLAGSAGARPRRRNARACRSL